MNTYFVKSTYTGREAAFFFSNKKNAIEFARARALVNKESQTIYKNDWDNPIIICEFPNYLRNCNLDEKDITINTL